MGKFDIPKEVTVAVMYKYDEITSVKRKTTRVTDKTCVIYQHKFYQVLEITSGYCIDLHRPIVIEPRKVTI